MINRPLVNWNSFQSQKVIEAINTSKGFIYESKDDEMLNSYKILFETEGINCLPAAASALTGFIHFLPKLCPSQNHVVIITG